VHRLSVPFALYVNSAKRKHGVRSLESLLDSFLSMAKAALSILEEKFTLYLSLVCVPSLTGQGEGGFYT
jgi:hypothetical protein